MANLFRYPNKERNMEWVTAAMNGVISPISKAFSTQVHPSRAGSLSSVETFDLNELTPGSGEGAGESVQNRGGGASGEVGDLFDGGVFPGSVPLDNEGGGASRDLGALLNGGVLPESVPLDNQDGGGSVGGSEGGSEGDREEDDNHISTVSDGSVSDVSRNKDAILDILDDSSVTVPAHGPLSYLKWFFDMMYAFGTSTFRPLMERCNTRSQRTIRVLNTVLFWPLCIFSVVQSLCLAKLYFLDILSEKKYSSFVGFALHATWVLAKVYETYIYGFNKENTDKMFISMAKYEVAHHPTNSGAGASKWSTKPLPMVLVAMLTGIAGVIRAFSVTGTNKIEDHVKTSSFLLSQDLFLWSIDPDKRNATITQLDAQYGTELTPTTIAMAAVVFFRDVASFIQVGMMLNRVVIVAVVLTIYVLAFIKEVKTVVKNVPAEDQEKFNALQAKREKLWTTYQALRDVVVDINHIFDPLFKFLHVTSLLLFAFLMTTIIDGDFSIIVVFLCVIDLVKAEIWYIVAGRIAAQNDTIREWLTNWGIYSHGEFRANNQDVTAILAINQLNNRLISLGSGKFVIHDEFHFKLLGLVMTVYFSIADEE